MAIGILFLVVFFAPKLFRSIVQCFLFSRQGSFAPVSFSLWNTTSIEAKRPRGKYTVKNLFRLNLIFIYYFLRFLLGISIEWKDAD